MQIQAKIVPTKKGKIEKYHFEEFSFGLELLLEPECPL
jgi:hypothetical protein